MKKAKDIPLDEALYARVLARTRRDETTGCLLWEGGMLSQGYGRIKYQGKTYFTHRITYCFHHNVINLEEGYELDHLCRVRACVEPLHLEAVTRRTNILRGDAPAIVRARYQTMTHCKRGHELSGENIWVTIQKSKVSEQYWELRSCRLCQAARNRTQPYDAADRERRAAYSRTYHAANREKIAEQKRAWQEANKEKIAAQRRGYREMNKEKIQARDRAYRARKKASGHNAL